MKRLVLTSAAMAALAIPMVAMAAEDAEHADESTASTHGDSEIIVTAQRRAQSLQNVPLAVTAVRGESLEEARITSVPALQTATPGLRSPPANRPETSTSIQLRGVGTSGHGGDCDEADGFADVGTFRFQKGGGVG